jgi:PhoD-like phosphatase
MSELAELVLGPVVRFVDPEEATVWVETDRPCEVRVLDAASPTFAVDGHHYALVCIGGLEPGSSHEYEVLLDGERRWPEPGSDLPPSTIRTPDSGGPIEVVFGSCRVALPHEPPFTLSKDEHPLGREHDALRTLALEMISGTRSRWPDLLLMLGDQVYVDEGSPRVREWIRSRRDVSVPPGEEVANFEEYTRLYKESWGEPVMRWLLSVVPTSMVIDDHDMHDDWLISREWIEEMRREPWWEEREIAGLMSYWVYQHLGNLSPRELEENPEYQEARAAEDSVPVLRRFAKREGRVPEGKRWSFCTDIDNVRVVVADDRTGRVLDHDRRSIFDDEEWSWIEDHATGGFDHLLIGTTDPFLLGPGLHYVEAWNEAVCDGAWGEGAAKLGERIRRALDLDHWAAFQFSFRRFAKLLEAVGAGRRERAPATIGVLSGDVHHAYLADVAFPRDAGVTSSVYQAVCSPFRNALDSHEQLGVRFGMSRAGRAVGRSLARAAGVDDPEIRWRVVDGPYFDNQVATLTLDGRTASIRLERAVSGTDRPRLERLFERRLS